jgi:hypothetical protein
MKKIKLTNLSKSSMSLITGGATGSEPIASGCLCHADIPKQHSTNHVSGNACK